MHASLKSTDFFFQIIIFGIQSVSNSLYPDQARLFVGSDLDPNCSKAIILIRCLIQKLANGVARTLKKLCASKVDYWIKQILFNCVLSQNGNFS